MNLPPLNAVRAFDAVALDWARCVRLPDELSVTPAAVSQQLRVLESHLGLALTRREGRGLALTDSGRDWHDDVLQASAGHCPGCRTAAPRAQDRPGDGVAVAGGVLAGAAPAGLHPAAWRHRSAHRRERHPGGLVSRPLRPGAAHGRGALSRHGNGAPVRWPPPRPCQPDVPALADTLARTLSTGAMHACCMKWATTIGRTGLPLSNCPRPKCPRSFLQPYDACARRGCRRTGRGARPLCFADRELQEGRLAALRPRCSTSMKPYFSPGQRPARAPALRIPALVLRDWLVSHARKTQTLLQRLTQEG